MSSKDISHLNTLCAISDDYADYLDTLSSEDLHIEHKEVFGIFSEKRISAIKTLFENTVTIKKKEIASSLMISHSDNQTPHDVVNFIIDKFGSLKNFFTNGFLSNQNMPHGLTLQYRNMKEVTDEDIVLLIEALYENGGLKMEDDET
jgi:hypothetical protein